MSTHSSVSDCCSKCTPTIAVDDPQLMVAMPKGLTAATGMDALTHAVEAYVSTISNPVTDASALHAMKLISTYLRGAVANGKDMQSRDMMSYAQFLAGMAFNSASLGGSNYALLHTIFPAMFHCTIDTYLLHRIEFDRCLC